MATCYRHPGPGDQRGLLQLRAADLPRLHDRRPRSACAAPSARASAPRCVGSAPGIRVRRGAPATYVLIAINVDRVHRRARLGVRRLAPRLRPAARSSATSALFGPAVANGDWYRLVTAGFLHAGLLHIAVQHVRPVLPRQPARAGDRHARGSSAVYFVSLLAGLLRGPAAHPDATTVGASGAIFGLMSAAFIVARHRGSSSSPRRSASSSSSTSFHVRGARGSASAATSAG